MYSIHTNQLSNINIIRLFFAHFYLCSHTICFPHIKLHTPTAIIKMNYELSKREQNKIMKAIQLIEANQPTPHNSKPRKKRKLSSQCSINPSPSLNQQDPDHTHQTKSTNHLTPLLEKTREAEESAMIRGPKQDGGLNKDYPLQNIDVGTYLIGYQYRQSEKNLQKEYRDWRSLDEMGQALMVHKYASSDLCRRLGKVIGGFIKSKKHIFSKQHMEFGQLMRKFANSPLKN